MPNLKRDLDARARSEAYRSMFRLPVTERLDGDTACCLWLPYKKTHTSGRLYVSRNYVCFDSKVCRMLWQRVLFPESGPAASIVWPLWDVCTQIWVVSSRLIRPSLNHFPAFRFVPPPLVMLVTSLPVCDQCSVSNSEWRQMNQTWSASWLTFAFNPVFFNDDVVVPLLCTARQIPPQ